MGKWFAKNPEWRQRVIVATSISGYKKDSWAVGHRNADGGPPGLARLDRASVKKACQASLRRLQTDYIDVFQLQWPDRYVPASGSRSYNPSAHNLGLLAWGPLHGGVLTGKYSGGRLPKGSRSMLFPGLEPRYRWPKALAAADEYCRLAEAAGVSPSTMALQWCQSRWFVASTIIGATRMEQLKENIDAFDGHVTQALAEDVLAGIERVFYDFGNPSSFSLPGRLPGTEAVPGRPE